MDKKVITVKMPTTKLPEVKGYTLECEVPEGYTSLYLDRDRNGNVMCVGCAYNLPPIEYDFKKKEWHEVSV